MNQGIKAGLFIAICIAFFLMFQVSRSDDNISVPQTEEIVEKKLVLTPDVGASDVSDESEGKITVYVITKLETEEQIDALHKRIIERIDHIANNYPVEELRLKVKDLIVRIMTGEVDLYLLPLPSGVSAGMIANRTEEGQLFLVIYYEAMQLTEDQYGYGSEAYDDALVTFLLHEYFHLFVQVPWDWENVNNRHREIESEAWVYTLESVLKPAARKGRFYKFFDDFTLMMAAKAYMESNKDLDHPAWKAFLDKAGNDPFANKNPVN